jgi:hypothetical protein
MIPLERPADTEFCGKGCRYRAYWKRRKDEEAAAMSLAEAEQVLIRVQIGDLTKHQTDQVRTRPSVWEEVNGPLSEAVRKRDER